MNIVVSTRTHPTDHHVRTFTVRYWHKNLMLYTKED